MVMMMVFLHTVSCWFHICRFCSYKRHFWLVSIRWITVGCCTRLRWLKWKTIRKIYANGNWDGDWWGKRNAINRKPKPVKIRIAPSTKIVAVYCLLASEFWNVVVLVLTMVNKRQQQKRWFCTRKFAHPFTANFTQMIQWLWSNQALFHHTSNFIWKICKGRWLSLSYLCTSFIIVSVSVL